MQTMYMFTGDVKQYDEIMQNILGLSIAIFLENLCEALLTEFIYIIIKKVKKVISLLS